MEQADRAIKSFSSAWVIVSTPWTEAAVAAVLVVGEEEVVKVRVVGEEEDGEVVVMKLVQ